MSGSNAQQANGCGTGNVSLAAGAGDNEGISLVRNHASVGVPQGLMGFMISSRAGKTGSFAPLNEEANIGSRQPGRVFGNLPLPTILGSINPVIPAPPIHSSCRLSDSAVRKKSAVTEPFLAKRFTDKCPANFPAGLPPKLKLSHD
jgi:hypothetical protein